MFIIQNNSKQGILNARITLQEISARNYKAARDYYDVYLEDNTKYKISSKNVCILLQKDAAKSSKLVRHYLGV